MPAEDPKTEKHHDIVNSAGVIRNLADLLLDEEADPLKRDMLGRIKARAERLAELMR